MVKQQKSEQMHQKTFAVDMFIRKRAEITNSAVAETKVIVDIVVVVKVVVVAVLVVVVFVEVVEVFVVAVVVVVAVVIVVVAVVVVVIDVIVDVAVVVVNVDGQTLENNSFGNTCSFVIEGKKKEGA